MVDNSKLIKVNLTFKNTEATDPLKEYARNKIENCLKKFAHKDTEAHVVLVVEKNRHIAEISMYIDGAQITGREESDDLYVSIDALVDSLTMQLRKHKEKLTGRH
jgi:putative sigma-54 modulation protein